MKLRLNVFGYEIASLDLDIEREETPAVETIVAKVVKATSRSWMRGLLR